MKDENKRSLYLKVRVSPEEMDAIKWTIVNKVDKKKRETIIERNRKGLGEGN